MHNTIGAVGGDKDYSQSVKVKYILNRDYDNQNPYKGDSIYADKNYGDNSSKYPDGVFYPL